MEPTTPVLENRFAHVWAALQARAPENEIEPGLERISRVLELMGHPERSYRVIHIAGTNGKTTTARIAELLLHKAGLRTGRLTSPHLHSPTERIAIDTRPVSEELFVQAYDDVLPFVDAVDAESTRSGGPAMTMFEVLTAMQFQALASAPVDVAVVETGIGGRWDASNVVEPDVVALTPIGFDHQAWLGESIEQIAEQKAGILKAGAFAVIAAQPFEEALTLIRARARELGMSAAFEGEHIEVISAVAGVGGQMLSLHTMADRYDEVFLSLLGEHHAHNALVAVAACEALLTGGDRGLDHALVREALAEVTSPGRNEVVRQAPTILVDAAHNPAGARTLVATVRENFRFTHTVGIVGILEDKDAEVILEELEPLFDHIVVTQSSSARALPADRLASLARDVFADDDRVSEAAHLPDAIQIAVDRAESAGGEFAGIVATGSVTIAGEVRQLLGAQGQ